MYRVSGKRDQDPYPEQEREIIDLLSRAYPNGRVTYPAVIGKGQVVDCLLEEKGVRTVIEISLRSQPLDGEYLIRQARQLQNLIAHSGDIIHSYAIVSTSGFTAQAIELARSAGIGIVSLDELRQLAGRKKRASSSTIERPEIKKPYVFVLMPFAEKYDVVYQDGIRRAVEDANMVCERLDEVLFVGDMVKRIVEQIQRADIVVADTTNRNPNVFYEIGIAHALDKPVVFVTQHKGKIPFDISTQQHIKYHGDVGLLHKKLLKLLISLRKDLEAHR